MPSSVNIGGQTQYVPGIYGSVDASALGGKSASVGNLAVVGLFPSFEHDVPVVFDNPQAMRDWDPSDAVLQRLARLAFTPATDDRVSGANTLTLVNAKTNLQAKYEFLDGAAAKSIIIKSKRWGLKGNQVYVQLKSNATDITKLDVIIAANGKSETYSGLGTGQVASFLCDCSELVAAAPNSDTAKLSLTKSSLVWAWDRLLTTLTGAADTFTGNLLVVDGQVKMKAVDAAVAPGETLLMTVTGLNKSGVATTGYAKLTQPFAIGAVAVVNAAADGTGDAIEWSRLDTVKWDAGGGYAGTAPRMTGNAFNLTLTEENGFSYISDVIAYINNYSAKGWKATASQPLVGAIPASAMDKITDVTTLVAARVDANVWGLLKGLENSQLVTAERSAGVGAGETMPLPSGQGAGTKVEVNLLGGAETPNETVATIYADALSKLETEDIQVVVVMSTSIDAGTALLNHCKAAALAGSERNGYFGAPATQTLATIYSDYVAKLNTRHVSVLGQQIELTNPLTGVKEALDPPYAAVLAGALQCGVPVGTPLTNKRPAILGTKQDSGWTLITSDNDVIKKGIYAFTKDTTGYKVLRSLTSWVQDDNVAFCEVSANASINYSIRDLRALLIGKVGDPADMTPGQLKGIIEARLTQQEEARYIYAWKRGSVVITKVGDKYRIDYDVAPMFPFNFGDIWAHAYLA